MTTAPPNVLAELQAAFADRYRVERELGSGGMATVYLAHDLRHDRDVAIKVLHHDLGATLGGERFLSEIRTTAKLQHPHILPLLDSGAAGDPRDGAGGRLLYYVMPYVTGETLRARLERERQLRIDDAVLIAREVADALVPRTRSASSTATSSPRTSCCRVATHWSPTSASRWRCSRPVDSA